MCPKVYRSCGRSGGALPCDLDRLLDGEDLLNRRPKHTYIHTYIALSCLSCLSFVFFYNAWCPSRSIRRSFPILSVPISRRGAARHRLPFWDDISRQYRAAPQCEKGTKRIRKDQRIDFDGHSMSQKKMKERQKRAIKPANHESRKGNWMS